MADTKSGVIQGTHGILGLDKPSVTGLLAHIFSSVFSNGMMLLLVFGSVVIAFLGYNNIPSGNYFVLLICSIVVLAFLRGCKAWQEDLNVYQQAMADARRAYQTRT